MKQYDKLVENLEAQYRVSVSEFLQMYQDGLSLDSMAEAGGTKVWTYRAIAAALNLRMALRYRAHDYALLQSRKSDEADDQLIVEIDLLHEQMEHLARDLDNSQRSVIRERARLRAFRKQQRDATAYEDIKAYVDSVFAGVEYAEYVGTVNTLEGGLADIQFVVLSDLHVDEAVTTADLGKINKYNWDTVTQRLGQVFEELHAVDYHGMLHIYLLGDIISGIIHNSLEGTDVHPVDAIVRLSDIMVYHLTQAARTHTAVEVFALTGNHERISEQVKSANKGFDFGYLFYKLLAAKLAGLSNTKVTVSTTGLATAPIANDRLVGLHHGDMFRGTSSDQRDLTIKEVFRQSGHMITHLIQGHTHKPEVRLMTSGVSITNGSLIGPNAYSHFSGFVGIPWSQVIGMWDSLGQLNWFKFITD